VVRGYLFTAPLSPNFFSSLLMPLFFVQHLFENLFVNSIALYPFNRYHFYRNLVFVAKHYVYKQCGDVAMIICNSNAIK